MPLPTYPAPISLNEIYAEFGGSVSDRNLQDYYAGGSIVPPGTVGFPLGVSTPIPSSGPITISNFYGATSTAVYVFDSSQVWTIPAGVTSVGIIAGAGGAGGGGTITFAGDGAGGGGAGGIYFSRAIDVVPGTNMTFTLGAGGAGGTDTFGATGNNTTVNYTSPLGAQTITALGGGGGGGAGGGGAPDTRDGRTGGSGGGGCGYDRFSPGGLGNGQKQQGTNGAAAHIYERGGGGGGFLAKGLRGAYDPGGYGGEGIVFDLGTPSATTSFSIGGGGGGGGPNAGNVNPGLGNSGSGNGGPFNTAGVNAISNSSGGGGGSGGDDLNIFRPGGNGGSGKVVVFVNDQMLPPPANIVNNFASNVEWTEFITSGPGTRACEIILQQNGTITHISTSYTGQPNWYAPTIPNVGPYFWIRATATGDALTANGSPLNEYISLKNYPAWGLSQSFVSENFGTFTKTATLSLTIYDSPYDAVVATATVVLYLELNGVA